MPFSLGTPPVAQPPYSPWKVCHIRTIERAIAFAWKRLVNEPGFVDWAKAAIEPDLTSILQRQLVNLLNTKEVRGFSAAAFAPPIRGQEVEDHSGDRKEKRPDLTFNRLASRPLDIQHAQFYECKIVGRGRTMDNYHGDGVMRFVDGRYAWGMPHAGMIAYVSPPSPSVAADALNAYWKADRASGPLAGLPTGAVEEDAASGPLVAVSVHSRHFVLVGRQPPGDIVLRHLWLSAVAEH